MEFFPVSSEDQEQESTPIPSAPVLNAPVLSAPPSSVVPQVPKPSAIQAFSINPLRRDFSHSAGMPTIAQRIINGQLHRPTAESTYRWNPFSQNAHIPPMAIPQMQPPEVIQVARIAQTKELQPESPDKNPTSRKDSPQRERKRQRSASREERRGRGQSRERTAQAKDQGRKARWE